MEEVKCSLLGFHSELLQQVLHAAPSSYGAEGNDSPQMDAVRHYCQKLPFHPTEQLLLTHVLPLGRAYAVLQQAALAVTVGRTEGLYPAALGSGIKKILQHYVEAVKAAAAPSAFAALPNVYALTFRLLEKMVEEQQRPEMLVPLLDRFLHHQEVPQLFRRFLGESVWLSVLYTTAHYVAHGVVLHARPDYFISLKVKAAATSASPAAVGGGAATTASSDNAKAPNGEEHTLYVDRLPPGVSADLGLLILAAGKERRVLLRDAEVQGGSDYLEQLALGSQDEAANAVFHSIFSVQLCHGGVLATEELAARVEAAKALWSKALWLKVGDVGTLKEHLAALRSVLLCHRGDVWFAFVERALPALTEAPSFTQRHGASEATAVATAASAAPTATEESRAEQSIAASDAAQIAFLQRTISDTFLFALSVSNLRDLPAYQSFTLRVASSTLQQASALYASAGPSPASSSAASTEDLARHLLHIVQATYVQYIPPQGLPLIVSHKSMQYYQRLFSFHLSLRFSLEALAVTRSLFSEALLTNTEPSSDLRRAYTLFHLLHFMESTIAYYVQVDVISACTAKLEEQLASPQCASVEQAKRFHDQFIWNVSEATFLTSGSEALAQACQALHTSVMTLYVTCTRYRIPYWAVRGVNETPVEVRATLSALEVRVQQETVAVFTGHLGLGTRPWERALWGRLDFNKFFSQHRSRPAGVPLPLREGNGSVSGGTMASSASNMFARPRSTGSGTAASSSANVAGARASTGSSTPRRARTSSRRAGAR